MTLSLVITPPDIVGTPDTIIFLAGPILGASNWQAEATEIIHRIDDSIVVASPRKDYKPGLFNYEQQVDWETHFLRRASRTGVIIFWLAKQTIETPGRAYAQTTRFELGEWKSRHQYEGARILVGIEEGFDDPRYIRRRLSQDCPDITVVDSLETLCQKAAAMLAGKAE